MVRDLETVPRAQDDFPERHVANEHLVEVAALTVGFSAGVDCRSEAELPQLLNDISHVVVEVTTYDNRSAGVLLDDVFSNIDYHLWSVLQLLLLLLFTHSNESRESVYV
jgi:hypothetical protein